MFPEGGKGSSSFYSASLPSSGHESPRIKCSYRALWELADPILASASRMYLRTCQGKDVLSTVTQFPIFQRQKEMLLLGVETAELTSMATTAPRANSLDPRPWLPFPSGSSMFSS